MSVGVGANEVGMRICGDFPKELGRRKWERLKMEAIIILHWIQVWNYQIVIFLIKENKFHSFNIFPQS